MNTRLVTDGDRWQLVDRNADAVRRFLEWAAACEAEPGRSLRWDARRDIAEARDVIHLFAEPWWAVTVYTAFNSIIGTQAVAKDFHTPLQPAKAEEVLGSITFPPGSVRMHRIQPGHAGARRALVAACAQRDAFHDVLHHGSEFDDRYRRLRALNAASWGRTTCYDLLLRSGALGSAGGVRYEPECAYLCGSTGPSRGFRAVWGIAVDDTSGNDCEALLRWWSVHWDVVGDRAGAVAYPRPAYRPADFENALCIYQEQL